MQPIEIGQGNVYRVRILYTLCYLLVNHNFVGWQKIGAVGSSSLTFPGFPVKMTRFLFSAYSACDRLKLLNKGSFGLPS